MTARTSEADDFRTASANLQYGGIGPQGGTGSLEETLTVLRRWEPHVLLLQEVTARTAEAMTPSPRIPVTWTAQEELAASRAAAADEATIAHLTGIADSLSMRVAALGPPRTETFRRMHNAVLVSPDLEVASIGPPVPVAGSSTPAWAEAVIRIPGARHEMAFYSVHLPARSAAQQRVQAEWLASLVAQEGRLTILGGDWNSISRAEKPAEGDLRAMNPHLRASRMVRVNDWELQPDYTVDDMFHAIGMEDAAAYLPPDCREPSGLAATGRSGTRVDRFYVTPQLVPALRGYCQTDEGGSDHHAIMISLDRQALEKATPVGFCP